MRIKVFYCAFNDILSKKNSGVAKKIKSQIEGFEKNNVDIHYSVFKNNSLTFDDGTFKTFSNRFSKRIFMYDYILKYVYKIDPDIIYIRYLRSDMFFINFLEKLKKNMQVKLLIEIPTYPYDYELNKISLKQIFVFLDKFYRKKLTKYVDRIITYSDKKNIFNIKTINISNGINITNLPIAKLKHRKEFKEINMISVSSLIYWHGIDRIIKSLGNYYINDYQNETDFKLHIVGDGPELTELKKLTNQYSIRDRVIFYGYMDGKKLDNIFKKADIAVGCLATFRKNIKKVKSIKNTEYAARGLPMFYSETNGDFDTKNFVHRVPHNESLINLNEIVKFYCDLTASPIKIRNYVKDNLTWEKQIKKIIYSVKSDLLQ